MSAYSLPGDTNLNKLKYRNSSQSSVLQYIAFLTIFNLPWGFLCYYRHYFLVILMSICQRCAVSRLTLRPHDTDKSMLCSCLDVWRAEMAKHSVNLRLLQYSYA